MRLAHERIALASDFLWIGNEKAAGDQIDVLGPTLQIVCSKMSELPGSDQTDVRTTIAPLYFTYAARLGRNTMNGLRDECKPDRDHF